MQPHVRRDKLYNHSFISKRQSSDVYKVGLYGAEMSSQHLTCSRGDLSLETLIKMRTVGNC